MLNVLRDELKNYYNSIAFRNVSLPFNPLKGIMDDFAEKHPDYSAMQLKAAQYEIIAEHFTPVVFRHTPFFSETGLKLAEYDGHSSLSSGGWLLCRNLHKYIDIAPEAFTRYMNCGKAGIHLVYGPYCDYDHHCFPFSNVLQKGLSGIHDEILAAKEKTAEPEQIEFYESALTGIASIRKIAGKFASAAKEMLNHAGDTEERACLTRIAESASGIPWNKPRNFYEGLACLWFLHELGSVMDGVGMSIIGHPDRMLIDLYRQDITSGELSREEAYDLVCRFLVHTDCKLNLNDDIAKQFNRGEQGDCLILGGTDESENEIFNELTVMFLKAHRELKLIYPKIHCRISEKISAGFLNETFADFASGRNVISFLNDDAIIPAQIKAGKELKDARNYVAGGCWEVIVEGCEHSEGANCYFNLAQMTAISIHHTPELEESTGQNFAKLDGAETFEEVYARIMGNTVTALKNMCGTITNYGSIWPEVNPCPFLSCCMTGCVESGKDYSSGGAKYSPHGVPLTSFAVFIDSLMSIKKLCFDNKICSLQELLSAVRNNWDGAEDLRQAALNCEHFGDDKGEAATLGARVLTELVQLLGALKNERGGKYQPGLYSYRDIIDWAELTRATPDGRRKGDFLTQGLTPSRTHASYGITSVISDAAALPLTDFPANSVLTISLSRKHMSPEIFASVMKCICKAKIGMLQLNLISREELEDAMKNPQNHQDLIVRLYGYSAKFITLDEAMQKEFITRNIIRE